MMNDEIIQRSLARAQEEIVKVQTELGKRVARPVAPVADLGGWPVAPPVTSAVSSSSDKWPKLAIVVGHNVRSQGAVRDDTGESEFDYNNRLALMILNQAATFELNVRIFNRQPGDSYSQEIRKVYSAVDEWGADASIELHFNAVSPAATGTETLSSGSTGSVALSRTVQKEMVKRLGLPDRGIKVLAPKDNGYLALISGKAPAILVEPFFNENPDDLSITKTDRQMRSLARAILQGADSVLEEWAA